MRLETSAASVVAKFPVPPEGDAVGLEDGLVAVCPVVAVLLAMGAPALLAAKAVPAASVVAIPATAP